MLAVYDIGIHTLLKPIWYLCIGVFSFCLLSWCTCMFFLSCYLIVASQNSALLLIMIYV